MTHSISFLLVGFELFDELEKVSFFEVFEADILLLGVDDTFPNYVVPGSRTRSILKFICDEY